MSEPITVRYFVHKKDDTGNKFCVDVTYDGPDDKDDALRTFNNYLEDHDLKLFAGPVAYKELVRREEEWAEFNKKRKERKAAEEARYAALRVMGEDYTIYDFNDFNVGPDLEKLLDDDATDELSHYDERVEGVFELLRHCFDKMRTEGEWRCRFRYEDENDGRFVWEPRLNADFWCGDEFPFTLDLRPGDILPALMEDIVEITEDFNGDDANYADVTDTLDKAEAALEGWMKAFANAIVALRQRADELKAKAP
jgi:hypothetical protein